MSINQCSILFFERGKTLTRGSIFSRLFFAIYPKGGEAPESRDVCDGGGIQQTPW